ncbi:MAG TPA: transglutaminase family protein [Arachnia sp.]|nr:transglutaminase family protein [Arachnia sp.]HMT87926.1 transglutaminase family protein [Arachnia sp.]
MNAARPADYLGADEVIESTHPDIVALARNLRAAHPDDEAFSAAAFEWVRDRVAHSLDAQDRRVTLAAADVLRERVGLCYAKSHLLVALLRAEGVPAGLCYQRLKDGERYVLHGLVAVHLRGGWHRLDPRGNKPGIDAQFSLGEESLAFVVDESAGDWDCPTVYISPVESVVRAFAEAHDPLVLCAGGLPSEIEARD